MAVQVVQQQEAVVTNGNVFSEVGNILGWFIHYWWAWLLMIVCIVAVFVMFYLYKKLDEERKQRDDVVFLRFKNLLMSCSDNAKKNWIRDYWNPVSLFLLIIPLFGWAIIPFVRTEASAKIRNIDGTFIGWYMGHTYLDDGIFALMYYVKKSWFFFKIPQIMLIPKTIVSSSTDEEGKEVLKYININPCRINKYTGDHDLNVKSIVKRGQYYWFPVLLTEDHQPINLAPTIMADLQKYTGYEILENLVSDFSSGMRSAVQANPDVRKAQLVDEKPKELEDEK